MNLRYLLSVGTSVKKVEARGYRVAEESMIPRFVRRENVSVPVGRQQGGRTPWGAWWGNVVDERASSERNADGAKLGKTRATRRDLSQVRVVRNDLTLEDIRLVPAQTSRPDLSSRAMERAREMVARARSLVNRAPVLDASPFRYPVSKGVKGAME